MKRLILMIGLSIFSLSASGGTISYMGFTFDDRAFADNATQVSGGSLWLGGGASNLNEALTGFSPTTAVFNTRSNDVLQLDFTDLLATNGPGTDIILFDCCSYDPFSISIRSAGESTFSDFVDFDLTHKTERTYAADEVLPMVGDREVAYAAALLIDLSAFGLESGALVDSFRLRALPNAKPNVEGDPYMAAVYSSAANLVEPSTMGLFGLGLGMLGWMKRKIA